VDGLSGIGHQEGAVADKGCLQVAAWSLEHVFLKLFCAYPADSVIADRSGVTISRWSDNVF
jgi:hypothetical protein